MEMATLFPHMRSLLVHRPSFTCKSKTHHLRPIPPILRINITSRSSAKCPRRSQSTAIVATAAAAAPEPPKSDSGMELRPKIRRKSGSESRGEQLSEENCEEGELVEALESLEEEAIMGEDEGREATDYNRRAHIFDACSKVFQDLKDTDTSQH